MTIRDRSLTRGCARCVARQQGSTATTGARSACPAGPSSGDLSTQVRQMLCKPFACNLSLFVKNNQDNFWHEWETYIFLQHLIEGLQNKYNFLTTNVNSAHEAEGYRYMTRIITPADVTIYCV